MQWVVSFDIQRGNTSLHLWFHFDREGLLGLSCRFVTPENLEGLDLDSIQPDRNEKLVRAENKRKTAINSS